MPSSRVSPGGAGRRHCAIAIRTRWPAPNSAWRPPSMHGAAAVAFRRAVARAAHPCRLAQRAHLRRPAHLRGTGFGGHVDGTANSSCCATAARWPRSPACHRITFLPMASCGATRCTTGSGNDATASRFWLDRLALQADRFDLLRIDHFRALEASGPCRPAPPPRARAMAQGTRRCAAAGRARELPQLELVAEDLGVITPEVMAAAPCI